MPVSNNISATLPPEAAKKILAALATIKEQMPFLIDLTPAQLQVLPRLGDKSLAFVGKCAEVVKQNPGILPGTFDAEEYNRDVTLVQELKPIALALRQLSELVDDTLIAAGSDAYMASLVVYQLAKLAGKGQGLDKSLDDLGKRFAKKVGPKTEKPATSKPAG